MDNVCDPKPVKLLGNDIHMGDKPHKDSLSLSKYVLIMEELYVVNCEVHENSDVYVVFEDMSEKQDRMSNIEERYNVENITKNEVFKKQNKKYDNSIGFDMMILFDPGGNYS